MAARGKAMAGNRRRKVVVGIVVGAVVLGGWALMGGDSDDGQKDIKRFEVRRLSFPVVLKEKGEVKAKTSHDVKCQVDGRSTIIWLIPEGTMVKEGDLLVELASEDIDENVRQQEINVAELTAAVEAAQRDYEIQLDESASNIRKAELKLQLAVLELEKYTDGEYPKQLREAKLTVEEAQRTFNRAEEDLEASEKLHAKGYITTSALEDDKFAKYKAEVNLEKAELSLRILEDYTHKATLPKNESDVTEARKELERVKKGAEAQEAQKKAALESKRAQLEIRQSRLDELMKQKEACTIKAPTPGLVVYAKERWRQESQIQEGAEVHKRQTLIELPDTSVMQVAVRIHESKLDRVKVGEQAAITIEGRPGETFIGVITKIAPMADSQRWWLNPDLKEYRTEITLDQESPGLKPGSTAQVEIVVDYKTDVLAVPIQAVYGFGADQYVFANRSRHSVEPVKVELGVASTEYVEVIGGLDVGQKIMTVITEDMKQMLIANAEKKNEGVSGETDESLLRELATTRPVTQPAVDPNQTDPNAPDQAGDRPSSTQPASDAAANKPAKEG